MHVACEYIMVHIRRLVLGTLEHPSCFLSVHPKNTDEYTVHYTAAIQEPKNLDWHISRIFHWITFSGIINENKRKEHG